jgi:hypothetical protein
MDDPKIVSPAGDSPLILEDEIFSDLAERKGTSLFLGKYSLNEVFAVMGKRNFFREARKRRLWPLVFDIDSTAYPVQRFRIFFKSKSPDNLIVDLKIREGIFLPKDRKKVLSGFPVRELKCLVFEWLTLQNPEENFSPKHQSLPGQQHPGLGMSKKIVDLFIYLGRLTRKDSLLAFPAYFHNAVLFSRYFHFPNPEKEAEVRAIRTEFTHAPIRQLAWAVHLNCLRTEEGAVYEWKAEEQLFPLARELKDYFGSRRYKEAVRKAAKKYRFVVDWDDLHNKMVASGLA